MKNQVVELVVYTIKDTVADEFASTLMPRFHQLINSFDGLVSLQSHTSTDSSHTFFDYVTWESAEAAQRGIEQYKTLTQNPAHAEVFAAFDKVIFSGHFKKID